MERRGTAEELIAILQREDPDKQFILIDSDKQQEVSEVIAKWMHLISDHVPKGYNDHGEFIKGECRLTLGMHTNCVIYWVISGGCGKFGCIEIIRTSSTTPMTEREHEDPSPDLTLICEAGYEFYGWRGKLYTDDVCRC